jgi:hypothetical protein
MSTCPSATFRGKIRVFRGKFPTPGIFQGNSKVQGWKWFFKKIPEIFWQIFPKAKSDRRFVNA